MFTGKHNRICKCNMCTHFRQSSLWYYVDRGVCYIKVVNTKRKFLYVPSGPLSKRLRVNEDDHHAHDQKDNHDVDHRNEQFPHDEGEDQDDDEDDDQEEFVKDDDDDEGATRKGNFVTMTFPQPKKHVQIKNWTRGTMISAFLLKKSCK